MKSSTKAELVGISEYLPYHIWLMNFLQFQGVSVQKKTLLQDNQSAIKMERNRQNSCTGNSRHIDIRYFFVKDQVESGNLDIKYCPTKEMVADLLIPSHCKENHSRNFVICLWESVKCSKQI